MSDINKIHYISVGKFRRLLDYLDKVGVDSAAIAISAGMDSKAILSAPRDSVFPSYKYSNLYEHAAAAMQKMDIALPWGAGIGTDVFRFMCYSIINCTNLGETLERAQRYQEMLYPLTGYRIQLSRENGLAQLHYDFDINTFNSRFSPDSWDRTSHTDTVAKASGLRVWFALMGWLVGRDVEISALKISAPPVSDAYSESLENLTGIQPEFNADHTALYFNEDCLRYRTVHTTASLDAFLEHSLFSLITQDSKPASTGAAIRSLLAKSGTGSLPSFEMMAENLHMSPSSLRRRLHGEDTSYQELKDLYRSDIAMRLLRNKNLKVHEIGEQLGFLESSSFIRSFRNWTGLTPKQYRSQLDDKTEQED
ncbi:AraC family transcriptional regulator [Zhongshania arctica]|uniref:AraC family transcriptional regulator ligand-binding domain-containing protein n=1 Tax=Zhongshania arctica TaxID=3238302 RepID=A0ABV3TYF9_9GAMM